MTGRQQALGQYIALLLKEKPLASPKLSPLEKLRAARRLLEEDFASVWSMVGKEAVRRVMGRALDRVW